MPEPELVNIKINGVDLQVPKGEKIIESARRIGVEIPFFCYHPRLSMEEGGANCRMCLVEVASKAPDGSVRKMPKPQTSCSLPATEGLEIQTETEQLVKDRRGMLEFLLINHPLDCPICDRGGECPLQNNTLHYGPPTSRFIEEKRHFPKAYPLSDYVVFDRERCIHCARCTRFTSDISGDRQLDFLFRGADMEVGTFAHTAFESKFSGNVIELCPVGALLSRTYRFKARPWDLLTQKSICTQCSNGCNIKIDYRLDNLQRVNARLNEAVNEEWTCDKGKFGMGYINADNRVRQPLIKKGDEFVAVSWSEAIGLIVGKLQEAGQAIGGIGGARSSNEDLFVWQRLFRETLKTNNLDHRLGPSFGPTKSPLFQRFGYHTTGNSIADLENMDSVLVFGSNLVEEQPILFLRARKGWRWKNHSVIEAMPVTTNEDALPNHVSEFAKVSLRYNPGTELPLINAFLAEMEAAGTLKATPKANLGGWNADKAAAECGASADDIRKAAQLLAAGKMAIVVGKMVTDHPRAQDILKALGDLAEATGNAGNLNVPVTEVNQQGAMDMGILPDSGPGYEAIDAPGMNTQQMLEAAEKGELKLLWLVGTDLVNTFYDPELARRALEACPFVVASALALDDTAQLADVVLPTPSVAERDGTYTNVERRVQRFFKAFSVSNDVHADWLIFQDVAARLGVAPRYFSDREIINDIARTVPLYVGCTARDIGDQGVRWTYPGKAE